MTALPPRNCQWPQRPSTCPWKVVWNDRSNPELAVGTPANPMAGSRRLQPTFVKTVVAIRYAAFLIPILIRLSLIGSEKRAPQRLWLVTASPGFREGGCRCGLARVDPSCAQAPVIPGSSPRRRPDPACLPGLGVCSRFIVLYSRTIPPLYGHCSRIKNEKWRFSVDARQTK